MILIAGGAGYIGSHANKRLNQKGFRTVVFDNLTRGHREFAKWGDFFFGGLGNREDLRACFRQHEIRAVMHFSAFAYVNESVSDPARYYQNNVSNTLNLLEVMREFSVDKFIFSSSCATYGNPLEIPIRESHPQNPVSPYGRTKRMVEEILGDYDRAYGLKHVNLRYFNAAGADPDGEIGEWHDPETHLIPLAVCAALGWTDSIRIFGTDYPTEDGTCVRDYIHVFDLADAHAQALDFLEKGNRSASFNLGSERGYSVKEVIETVRRKTGREVPVEESGRREGDPAVLISDSRRAREVLGWRPQYDRLEPIVETAVNWHRSFGNKRRSVGAGT